MKLALPLGLIVVAATSLACSSDEGGDRNNGGTAGTGTGTAGTSTGGTGTGGTGTGGTGTGGTGTGGAAGGGSANYTYGAEFTITEAGNVTDEAGTSGVNGNSFLTQSENMTVDAVAAHRADGLCFSGTTAIVPDANSYGTYWGAELGLNLKVIPDPDAPPVAADAGADAGAPELIPDPAGWPYGTAIGFSFKLVGNNPAAPDKGVPPSRIRFKALPVGSDGMQDNYCADLLATADGQTVNVLFSQITFECWAPLLGLDGTVINRVDPGPPRLTPEVPNPRALQNISWQIASDVMATTPAPIAFNFCIEDLKPITGM
jgi:hypothetical protein